LLFGGRRLATRLGTYGWDVRGRERG
jgi:hypothetical protein